MLAHCGGAVGHRDVATCRSEARRTNCEHGSIGTTQRYSHTGSEVAARDGQRLRLALVHHGAIEGHSRWIGKNRRVGRDIIVEDVLNTRQGVNLAIAEVGVVRTRSGI